MLGWVGLGVDDAERGVRSQVCEVCEVGGAYSVYVGRCVHAMMQAAVPDPDFSSEVGTSLIISTLISYV